MERTGEVLACVRAPRFLAPLCAVHGDRSVRHEVRQLQRLDQVRVPDQRAVGERDVKEELVGGVDLVAALGQCLLFTNMSD